MRKLKQSVIYGIYALGSLSLIGGLFIYQAIQNTEDYIRVILTDEEELYEPLKRLRQVYPNIILSDFDNSRTKMNESVSMSAEKVKEKSAQELFEEFYKKQNNVELSEEQKMLIDKICQEVSGL